MSYHAVCKFKHPTSKKIGLSRKVLVLLLAATLSLVACQEDSKTSSPATDEEARLPQGQEIEVVPETSEHVWEAEPPARDLSLDMTLPPDLEHNESPLPQVRQHARLPDLFESKRKSPTQVSGELLFEEGHQEGVLDNISGAQVEVSIPIE